MAAAGPLTAARHLKVSLQDTLRCEAQCVPLLPPPPLTTVGIFVLQEGEYKAPCTLQISLLQALPPLQLSLLLSQAPGTLSCTLPTPAPSNFMGGKKSSKKKTQIGYRDTGT